MASLTGCSVRTSDWPEPVWCLHRPVDHLRSSLAVLVSAHAPRLRSGRVRSGCDFWHFSYGHAGEPGGALVGDSLLGPGTAGLESGSPTSSLHALVLGWIGLIHGGIRDLDDRHRHPRSLQPRLTAAGSCHLAPSLRSGHLVFLQVPPHREVHRWGTRFPPLPVP